MHQIRSADIKSQLILYGANWVLLIRPKSQIQFYEELTTGFIQNDFEERGKKGNNNEWKSIFLFAVCSLPTAKILEIVKE